MRLAQTEETRPNKKRRLSTRDSTSTTRPANTNQKPLRQNPNAVLDDLLNEANELLEVVLESPVGAQSAVDAKEMSLLDWQKEEEWLKEQLQFYKVLQAKIADNPQHDEVLEEDEETELERQCIELETSIMELQDQVFAQSTKNLQDKLIVKRLLQQQCVTDVVYPQQEQSAQDKSLKNLFIQRDQKVSEVLHLHQQRAALTAQITEFRQEISELQISTRDKNKKLQSFEDDTDLNDEQTAALITGLEDELKKVYDKHFQLRCIFQGILLESGVNWARDPALRAIWMSLSNPVATEDGE